MYGYLSIPEAALLCSKSYNSMYQLATAGRLGPVKKHGRLYFLSLEGVESYKASQAEKRASKAAK